MNITSTESQTILSRVNNTSDLYTSYTPVAECHWSLSLFEWTKTIMLFVGGVANALTVFVIVANKAFHNVTYVTIAHIAFADFLYCMCSFAWMVFLIGYLDTERAFRTYVVCVNNTLYDFLTGVLVITMNSSYLVSAWSVATLSVFRYIIIVHPFKSSEILRKHLIVIIFVVVWSTALSFEVSKHTRKSKILKIISDLGLSYTLPCIILIIFHTLKIINLRRNQFRKCDKQIQKMERIVITAVSAFGILPLMWQLLTFLQFASIYKAGYWPFTIAGFLIQLNNCINPILYALLSPRIRIMVFKLLFCCCCSFDVKKLHCIKRPNVFYSERNIYSLTDSSTLSTVDTISNTNKSGVQISL